MNSPAPIKALHHQSLQSLLIPGKSYKQLTESLSLKLSDSVGHSLTQELVVHRHPAMQRMPQRCLENLECDI